MHRRILPCIYKCFSKHFIIYLNLQNNPKKEKELLLLFLGYWQGNHIDLVQVTWWASSTDVMLPVTGGLVQRIPPMTQVDNFLHIPLVFWVLEMEGRKRTSKSWNICHWPWSLRSKSRNNVILQRFTLVWVGDSNQDLLFSSLTFPEIVSAMHDLCEHIEVTQECSFQV